MSAGGSAHLEGDRLAGKVALIVGAGSTGDYPGTGSAMACLFAAQGARVVVMGRTEEHTARTVGAVLAIGGEAVASLGDTTVAADCAAAVQAALDAYGRLDVVVNNVAVHKHVTVDGFDEDVWDE